MEQFVSGAQETYCHFLWDNAFIEHTGDVYACCHNLPGVIGNILRDDMATIWASPEMDSYRRQSLNGTLRCAPRCNILTPEQKSGNRPPLAHLDHPRRIKLLYGELCNIRCIMCPQDHGSKVMLDGETLKRNLDWGKVREIELQGGEILAMKGAKDFYIWLTGEMGRKVNLITNGTLINAEWADRLVLNGNWVQVSVNAATKATHEIVNIGSRFERVIDNIGALVAAKQRNQARAKIIYKFTAVPENMHEIADAIEYAWKLGCDEIAFGYDRSAPAFLAARPDLVLSLRRRLADLLDGRLPIKVERIRLQYLGLIDYPAVLAATSA